MSALRMAGVTVVAALLAVFALVLLRPGAPPAATADPETLRAAEDLRRAAARVEEVERRKKELEAQVGELERLSAGSTARLLTTLETTARALGLDMREID